MIFSKIWERYFFFETLKTLFFFLLSIYFAFVLMDFSTNGSHFYRHHPPSALEMFLYYLHQFAHYLDIFLPLTLLLSTIKVLLGMNARNELTALQIAGVSYRKLCRPFFCLALFLSLFSFFNAEFIAPHSQEFIEEFEIAHSKNPEKKRELPIQVYSLSDQTKLIFRKYDPEKKTLSDVFWIKSRGEIYHCKKLLMASSAIGLFVDHFKRNSEESLQKVASYEKLLLEIPSFNLAQEKFNTSVENRPLSTLFFQIAKKRYTSKEEKAGIMTSLHFKLVNLLLPFLIVIALLPFCLRFSRYIPSFLFYAFSLFGLVIFFTMLDAASILSENQILSPHLLMWTPFILTLLLFGFRFKKCTK